jgi:hypothetical protein
MASPSVLVLAGTKKPAKAKRQSRFLSLALAAFVKRPQAELKSALNLRVCSDGIKVKPIALQKPFTTKLTKNTKAAIATADLEVQPVEGWGKHTREPR